MWQSAINAGKVFKAASYLDRSKRTIVYITNILRARELKLAAASRSQGWNVVLIYLQTTPFNPEKYFDVVLKARSEEEAIRFAHALRPHLCHVFTGAIDDLILSLCRNKPGPVVVDLNDVFCDTLFDYCEERFEPTRECLRLADGLVARDRQAKFNQKYCGAVLPKHVINFPEYCWSASGSNATSRKNVFPAEEVHIVSVGTFCLETQGIYDTGYLSVARKIVGHKIHFHIYPHWAYRSAKGSKFNPDFEADFADFIQLDKTSEYFHLHKSLSLGELANELPKYDYGMLCGGCPEFDQKLTILKNNYMRACYSGRISDYLEAGLPVMVNPEVEYNFWLMKRYGAVVDLKGVLQPDFKDKMLALKQAGNLHENAVSMARHFSVDRQAHRLTEFYSKVIAAEPQIRNGLGAWSMIGKRLPVLKKKFIRDAIAANEINKNFLHARRKIEDLKIQKELIESSSEKNLKFEKNKFNESIAEYEEKLERLRGKNLDIQREKEEIKVYWNKKLEENQQEYTKEILRKDELINFVKQENKEKLLSEITKYEEKIFDIKEDRQKIEFERERLYNLNIELEAQKISLLSQQRKSIESINELTKYTDKLNKDLELLTGKNEKLLEVNGELTRYTEKLSNTLGASEKRNSILRTKLYDDGHWRSRFESALSENHRLKQEAQYGEKNFDEIGGLINWHEIQDSREQANNISTLSYITRIHNNNPHVLSDLSEAWKLFQYKHLNQLLGNGYNSFKKTLGLNYFTFPVEANDPQLLKLESQLDSNTKNNCLRSAGISEVGIGNASKEEVYSYFLYLLWAALKEIDRCGYGFDLSEPNEGSPLTINLDGRDVSQDLANSIFEFYSMDEFDAISSSERILEVGAGYGRVAYVVLKILSGVQYAIVDVPPAIYVSQRYLTNIFPDKKIFFVQEFDDFNSVKDQIEMSSIIFLLPHQLEKIPDKWFDMSLTISSLAEFSRPQLMSYLQEISRLTNKYCYLKQWKEGRNAFDNEVIKMEEYEMGEEWEELYLRECFVQTEFSEQLIKRK